MHCIGWHYSIYYYSWHLRLADIRRALQQFRQLRPAHPARARLRVARKVPGAVVVSGEHHALVGADASPRAVAGAAEPAVVVRAGAAGRVLGGAPQGTAL